MVGIPGYVMCVGCDRLGNYSSGYVRTDARSREPLKDERKTDCVAIWFIFCSLSGLVLVLCVLQPFWGVGDEIAVLANRAALKRNGGPERRERLLQSRRAVDNEQFRGSQAARNQVVEHHSPGRVDPQAWLADVLARIAGHPAHRLDELLPWNWKAPALALPAKAA
jgi:IS66 C-terminal element